MGTIFQDFRFALRRLRSDGGFTASVLAMLALGLAASIGMFSVLRGVVLSAMPYPDAERIVTITSANTQQDVRDGSLTGAEALRLAEQPSPFEAVGYYTWNGITIVEGDEPREITVNWINGDFFKVFGLRPLHGRLIEERDVATDAKVVVLSHAEWQRLFGGDANAIGKLIDTDNGPLEVIGVMPPEFTYPWSGIGAWQPFMGSQIDRARPGFWQARFVQAVGRVAPGLSDEQLDAQLAQVAATLRETYELPDNGWRIATKPVLEEMIAAVRPVLWGAFAIALLVLLIACTNSAIMLDARLIARTRELAIAQALGAGVGRLRRILAIELGVLVAAAAGVGVLLIGAMLERFRAFAENSLPRADTIALDGGVVGFAAAAGVAALGFIVLQGWRISTQPAEALRRSGSGFGSRGATRRRRLLPAIGIALSTIAVACAVALALSLIAMQSVSPGLRTENVFVVQMFREGGQAQWGPFAEQMLERMKGLPGVEHVAVSTSTPMSGIGTFVVEATVPGAERPEPVSTAVRRVSPGYLDTLQIPLLAGRAFEDGDRQGSEPVAIVSRTLAKRMFGDSSPLDRSIVVNLGGKSTAHRIVGVAEDTRNDTLRTAPNPEMLVPFAQSPWVGMSFIAYGATLDASILKAIQAEIWAIDPREGITRAFGLDEDLQSQLAPSRFFVVTIGIFALASLLLGTLGVYAVTAFVQRQRTPEYGLKLAIGAPPRAMAREILGETLRVAAVGLVAGLGGAWLALRLLSGQLFEIGAADVTAYAAAVIAIATTALLASVAPALRAARVDPMSALRNE